MNWIERVYNNLWRPRKIGNQWFYSVDGNVDVFQKLDYLSSFNCVPELNAVINLKARSFSNGIIKAVDKNGKEVDKVPKCLKSPNWFQDQKEFMRQTKLFHEIYGNEYLYMLFGVGFDPSMTKALYTIPPNLVEVEYLEEQPFFVFSEQPDNIRYNLVSDGKTSRIPTEQLIHLNDNRVTVTKANGKDILTGESKMRGLAAAINNLRLAYESRGIILKNRGALGILSNSTSDVAGYVPLDADEKKRTQEEYRNYGTLSNQNHLIITNANLKWQKMGVNPSELGLFEETEADFNKILDSYGVPPEMLVREAGATFENQNQARKSFYENTIIPEANEWISSLNMSGIAGDATLIIDYLHLPIFQEDQKMKSEMITSRVNSLSRMLQDQSITQDEYRAELFKLGIGDGKPIPSKAEDPNQQNAQTLAAQASLRGSVGGVQGLLSIQQGVVSGTTSRESALSMLMIIYGFSDQEANSLLGQPSEADTGTSQGTQSPPPFQR